ncbi:hypothetical protein [Clostridium gasigenes]|uniref:Thymidylate kinase n=1 Tax=Clostridium gasigenes TaxID=94869 RepID=A0A1H0UEC4_9CLOT|nr:hypothetical protein SAMN04488529_11079 [Clostridium gasigenes]
MPTKLIIIEGLPGAGKSTTAEKVYDIFKDREKIYEIYRM